MTALEGRLASVSHLQLAEKAITEQWLPRAVKPFMVYCKSGQMRAFMFKEGGRYHVHNGWCVAWNVDTRTYVVTRRGRKSYSTTVKSFAYVYAQTNGQVAK